MVDNITSLQTQYLMEQERVRMDKEQHDDYTKTGLRHLVNSARIQLKLASITTGDVAAQHRALANNIIRSTHADMVRLGLIRIPEQIADLTNSVGTTNSPAMSHQDLEEVQHNDEDKSDPYKELQELIGLDAAKKAIKRSSIKENSISCARIFKSLLNLYLYIWCLLAIQEQAKLLLRA